MATGAHLGVALGWPCGSYLSTDGYCIAVESIEVLGYGETGIAADSVDSTEVWRVALTSGLTGVAE